MALLSRVFGWTPPDNAEYIDLLPPSQNYICDGPIYPNHISSADSTLTTSFRVEQDQPDTSSDSPLSTTAADNKQPDTTWVARPRNKFILFRCDYVRKHSCDGKRVRHGLGNEKSLSKQAAEAWHYLSKEERLYWKECAIKERTEHAKKYPNYKYRPKKSTVVRRRQSRSSSKNLEPIKTVSQKNTKSSYNHWTTPTVSLPSQLQIPSPSPSINTPDSDVFSPNAFHTNAFPSTFSSVSLSNWSGDNVVYQTPPSNLHPRLEMALPMDNTTGNNPSVMHEYTTGGMGFTPPPTSSNYQQQPQQQQQLFFDNSLYQPTWNLWTSYPIDNGTQMDITSQVDLNAAYWHACAQLEQATTYDCAPYPAF